MHRQELSYMEMLCQTFFTHVPLVRVRDDSSGGLRARVVISQNNSDAFYEINVLILRASIDDSFTYINTT